MKKQLTYEEFAEAYKGDSETRDQLRKRYPKFAAKAHLIGDGNNPALREGSTVFVIVRKLGKGYSRSISLFTFAIRTGAGYQASPESPALQALTLTYNVAKLMGYTVHECDGHDVLRTDDYAQEFVAHLSQALFGIDKASALRCEVL